MRRRYAVRLAPRRPERIAQHPPVARIAQAPSPTLTRLPSKKFALSISRSSVLRRRPNWAAIGSAVCCGALQRARHHLRDVPVRPGPARPPWPSARRLRQPEPGQPAVQDLGRVVHLAVAEQVHDVRRLGLAGVLARSRGGGRAAAASRQRRRRCARARRRRARPRRTRPRTTTAADRRRGAACAWKKARSGPRPGVGARRSRRPSCLGEEDREHVAGGLQPVRHTLLGQRLARSAADRRGRGRRAAAYSSSVQPAQRGQAGGAGERVPGQRAGLVDRSGRRELRHDVGPAAERGRRQPTAHDLAVGVAGRRRRRRQRRTSRRAATRKPVITSSRMSSAPCAVRDLGAAPR